MFSTAGPTIGQNSKPKRKLPKAMAKSGNGSSPGGDGDATKTAGKAGNADPDKSAELDETDDQDNGDGDGTEGNEKPKARLYTPEEINDLISRRVKRAKKDADEAAKLSREQLLEKERDDAIAQVRRSNARDSFIAKSGIDYGKASRLFKMYESELEFDDDGKPENLTDVLKTAKTDWPELFGGDKKKPAGGADLGDGQGDKGKDANSMNANIRKLAGRG